VKPEARLELARVSDRLQANARVFEALVEHVPLDQARWKPEPGKWSILEVVCHLADEEVEDFRTRLDLTLFHPGVEWPAIDPEGWPKSRLYSEHDLGEVLDRFRSERTNSVAWLRGLRSADLSRVYQHPKAGIIHAGDLLASWLDHDLIHIRQITRLHHQWHVERARPFGTEYAGGF
jgi:hypothetical protein